MDQPIIDARAAVLAAGDALDAAVGDLVAAYDTLGAARRTLADRVGDRIPDASRARLLRRDDVDVRLVAALTAAIPHAFPANAWPRLPIADAVRRVVADVLGAEESSG